MNRHDKRARLSIARKATPTVSTKLLQEQVAKLTHEDRQLRAMLIAVAKEQGRIRISRAVFDSLTEQDGLDGSESGGNIYLTYVQSNMLVPGGVEGGKPKESA